MGTIRVDYENARASASKLESAASDCAAVIRKLKSVQSKLPSCWEGESADAFQSAVQKRAQEMQKLQSDAEQLAATLRRVADDFEEAERKMKDSVSSTITSNVQKGLEIMKNIGVKNFS